MQAAVLSKSEFEIAQRIALGQSKKEVAYQTHRSVYTVETTVKNIYEKLGFNKLSDLVLWYCGQKFGISIQISELKKKVIASGLILLFCFEILNASDVTFARLTRTRRRQETEILIN